MKPCIAIIPSSLTSVFVPAMKASDLDSTAVSQIFAVSLTARGKHSPSQTWLRKWKADFWMRPLFSQMSQISHGQTTLHTWLEGFCPSVGLVSPSPALESEKPQRTSDGFSTSSQTEFPSFAPECSSQRMLKDSFPQGCQTDQASSGIVSRDWKAYITKLRQAYSARLKSAHRTSASASLSWATPTALLGSMYAEGNALERNSMSLASQASLTTWPTATTRDSKGCGNAVQRKDGKHRLDTLEAVVMFGLPAPANPSTDGSRPESWRTPSSSDGEGGVMEMREGCAGKYKLRDHVVAEQKSWATPRANKVHPDITEDNRDYLANRNKSNLEEEIAGHCGKATGKLNPRWVETLMGLPIGWTMPSCTRPVTIEPTNSDSSATESSQPPQKERLEFF